MGMHIMSKEARVNIKVGSMDDETWQSGQRYDAPNERGHAGRHYATGRTYDRSFGG